MKRKVLNILLISLLVISITSNVFALTPANVTADTTLDVGNLKTVGDQIVSIIRTVGVIAAVIILMVLGIKYMMGSTEERAEYKKSMLPYVIGAVILFAASTFAQVIYKFAIGITTT